jgi:CO/xanthine dehydrogenase Mo-binding subunit
VDVETGHVRLLNVVCADDVGKAVHPQQVQGQIEGAVVQAVGYALTEDFQQEGGFVQTDKLSTYLIPTILDIPDEVESVILEYPDPLGPHGARGMAEMPFIPLAPAVAAAVRDAVGVWYDEFPLTPERVLWGLQRTERA